MAEEAMLAAQVSPPAEVTTDSKESSADPEGLRHTKVILETVIQEL